MCCFGKKKEEVQEEEEAVVETGRAGAKGDGLSFVGAGMQAD